MGLGKQPEKETSPNTRPPPSFLVIQPQRGSAEATALKRSQSSEGHSCLLPRDDVPGAMAETLTSCREGALQEGAMEWGDVGGAMGFQ